MSEGENDGARLSDGAMEKGVFEEWGGMRLRETMKFEAEGKPSLKSESERLWEDSVGLSVFEFEWVICVLSDGHVEGWIEIEFKRLGFHLN